MNAFNLSRIESQVYIVLVRLGSLNGSQIAKELGLPRTSVYAALDVLSDRGMVFSTAGKPVVYRPEVPETLMERLKSEYSSIADRLKISLQKIQPVLRKDEYWNLSGKNQFINKTIELMEGAKEEILLSSNHSLEPFQPVLADALKRKVRVIFFSFEISDTRGLDLELFYNPKFHGNQSVNKRLLLVTDFQSGLIAGSAHDGEFNGVFSSDPLLVSVITEHIHHNIYAYEFEKKYNRDIFEESMRLHTLQEEYFKKL